jgi:hypothetical protein
LLQSSPAFHKLGRTERETLAQAMVKLGQTAAALLREEIESTAAVQEARGGGTTLAAPASSKRTEPRRALARAQAAGDSFSGVAADRVAGTTRAVLNAVSFPRFVTELINGVFKAIVDTNLQQMNLYVELLNNVASSTEGFADSNMGPDRAREWLAEKYPGAFDVEREESDGGGGDGEGPAPPPQSVLRLKPGASMPSPEALKNDLGLGDQDSVPGGDPETALVPLARVRLAKMRQEMLATMVMLGMQRIVIDSGKINAAMRFHIDTRSAAQDDRGSSFDFRNTVNASGSFGVGPWGVSAAVSNTIGYVSTQKTQTTEEMNTDLDLNSSVELVFKSDYLPLNRLASSDQMSRIRQNTRNPEAEEAKAAAEARSARAAQATQSDQARRASLDQVLAPKSPAPAATMPSPKPAPAPKPTAPTAKPTPPATKPGAGPQQSAKASP